MKKNHSAGLLFLAALSCLQAAACAQTDPVGKTDADPEKTNAVTVSAETGEPAEQLLSDGLEEQDFGGYNFRVLSCEFIGRELASFMMADTLNGDVVNDALYETTAKVEERFNVDISYYSDTDYNALAATVRKAVQSGVDEFDIQCGQDRNTAALATEGLLYNLYSVPQFDFEQPWWPKNIVDQLEIAGRLYLGSNYLTYNGLHWTRVLIANKDRFSELQLELPYDDIAAGTWYFDDLMEILQGASSDLDGNGVMDDSDFWAFCLGVHSYYCFQDSFALNLYDKSEDGIVLNPDVARTTEVLDKLGELFNDKTLCTLDPDPNAGGWSETIFRADRVLIGTSQVGTAYDSFRDLDIRYTILPYPKFDEKQEEYISTCTDAFWAIPVTAEENIDVIGTVIEALSCLNYQKVLPVYFETALKTKLSESPDDAMMYDIIKDTRTLGFAYAYSLPFDDLVSVCVLPNVNFSTYYAKWSKSAQRKANTLFETIMDLPG